ncbi:hypothetical protein [Pedobacter zeae]|uniref:Uncharacterized protein n=1 Tax=Pedobacter zeae TaxID=1737356 RepID=A0A7W6K9M9_9SPHI|nr:hypothetical protein [Pedobacter zeae]MBB4107744.1 hypothetical protein [Pedobacter zeae]GGG97315.1 hypothetical protein GCM10007422_09100 [Pedobacter zeae]
MATTATRTSTGTSNFDISKDLRRIFSERLRAIGYNEILKESIKQHEAEIADLNTEQMNKGIKGDGTEIGEYANIAYKGRLKPVDLYDTGSFHEKVYVELYDNAMEMNSKDSKTEKLIKKYGEGILDLTDENVRNTAEIVKSTMIEKVRQKL